MNAPSTIEPRVDHQPGDLGDPPDVLRPVGLGKSEVAVEAVADIVAIGQLGMAAAANRRRSRRIGDGRLARPGQAGEPEQRRAMALQLGAPPR